MLIKVLINEQIVEYPIKPQTMWEVMLAQIRRNIIEFAKVKEKGKQKRTLSNKEQSKDEKKSEKIE